MLQEQRFVRLGGDTRVEVDVRVIASSNSELKAEMAAGRFREDLFYRLNVVPLAMPPLAERRIDIPELARHFMTGAARHAGLPPRPITEEAMAVLQTARVAGRRAPAPQHDRVDADHGPGRPRHARSASTACRPS